MNLAMNHQEAESARATVGPVNAAAYENANETNNGLPLGERAYLEIEQRIATGELAPGNFLTENGLSVLLGIGRTPVREALQRLAREGMVVVMPRRGVLVSEIDVRSQLRLIEVRRELERLIARMAAARATADERLAFGQIAEQMRDAVLNGDELRFMRLDQEFDRLLLTAARNDFASKAIGFMSGLSRRFWFMHRQNGAQDLHTAFECHVALAEAVAAGNPESACRASDALMDYVEAFTRAALDW